jgi:hypothetical protein
MTRGFMPEMARLIFAESARVRSHNAHFQSRNGNAFLRQSFFSARFGPLRLRPEPDVTSTEHFATRNFLIYKKR